MPVHKSGQIILAWFLLLIPTLLLGFGALRLLRNEEARLVDRNRAAAFDRVSVIAANIDLSVAEVEDALQETLRSLPQDDLTGRLTVWRQENPLVRNVFVWQAGEGLQFPDPRHPASDEEAAFVRRYQAFFTNPGAWQEPPREKGLAPPSVSTVLAERRELRQLAQQAPSAATVGESAAVDSTRSASAPASAQSGRSGWRSWYADNRLHLLGWFAPAGSPRRYGVEVEMMALLSRLLGNLPNRPAVRESYALLDGNGAVFHQVGPSEVTAGSNPLAAAAVSALPHWRVVVYAAPNAAGAGGGIRLVGSLLVGTFTAAILLGGSLLLWQAWRQQREAHQKTSFVANVSHELKTPLTTVRMYAELLDEGTITEPERQRHYLQTIVKESERLTRLVNNILDFSRLEQGRRTFRCEPLDLIEVVDALLERQAPRLREAGMELERQLPSAPLTVSAERDALEQILLNLLDNAIKYAAAGQHLLLTVNADGDTARLRLRDFGPGIPAAHRSRVFEKFHRIDSSLTTRQQGSGLGLSIARQLAAGLGGRLELCPAAGAGSCFELTLPRTRTCP